MTPTLTTLHFFISFSFSFFVLMLCLLLLYRQHKRMLQHLEQCERLQKEVDMLHDCSLGLGKYLKKMQVSFSQIHVSSEQSTQEVQPVSFKKTAKQSEHVQTARQSLADNKERVDLAQSLSNDGATSDEMMNRLGITKVEAELIAAMQQAKQWAH